MEQNLTPTEISNPFKTGTRVFWFTNERSKRVFHAGTVTGYEYVDMPWKLYVIAEDKTGRTALLHPERLGGKLDVVPAMEGDCTQHVEDAAASALESTVRPANSWRLTSNAYI